MKSPAERRQREESDHLLSTIPASSEFVAIARLFRIMPQQIPPREPPNLVHRLQCRVMTRIHAMGADEYDEYWMHEALEQADLAGLAGDVPVGAIVVDREGKLIAVGHNRREQDQDPTAHAEIVALRAAARATGHWRIEGATLYCSLEPCTMCAGALVNARIARVVYGALDPKAGGIESKFSIGVDERLNHRFATRGGVLQADCVQRLQHFFLALRAAGQK